MSRLKNVALFCAVFCTTPGAAVAPPADAPPPGLVPAEISLSEVLSRSEKAVGHFDPGVAITEIWSEKRGDVEGTETDLIAGDDYRRDTDLGKTHFSSGRYHGQSWRQGYNGYTILESGLHVREDVDREALAAPSPADAGDSLLGRSADPPAYIVKVAPPDGRPEFLFYDASTYLLVRRERIVQGRRVVTRYEDFRPAAGATIAWVQRHDDGRAVDQLTETLQSVSTEASFDPKRLQPPASHVPLSLAAQQFAVPGRFKHHTVIVTISINGRKLDLELDSGASGILLDRRVADELGLQSFAAFKLASGEETTASRAIVPEIRIGASSLRNVEIITAPFREDVDENTALVGLLGFDFIAGCVLRIDYGQDTLEAFAPDAFVPPPGAVRIPVALDDGVPVLPATIGRSKAPAMILDTGSYATLLFSSFLIAHPEDTLARDAASKEHYSGRVGAVAGSLPVQQLVLENLDVGPFSLANWPVLAMREPVPSFEDEDIDGLLGQDFLRNFIVYLDYPHGAVYLVEEP